MPDGGPSNVIMEQTVNSIIQRLTPPRAAPALSAAPAPRAKFIGFTNDPGSAALLQEVLSDHLEESGTLHLADFRGAVTALRAMPTPEIILVDLTGEDQPINAMIELSDAVDPGTIVLLIGEIHSVNFYRTITKGMGVREYLPKPLTQETIAQVFLPVLGKLSQDMLSLRGGRMVALVGARGGVGASTIAANLAWFISGELHRHTALIDADLHTGTAALDLGIACSKGFCTALETPERVDNLLIERSMQPAGVRLHVLAGQEALSRTLIYKPGGAELLSHALRMRYNYVIADAGGRLSMFARELLDSAQQRVLVVDPTVIAIRNMERILAMQDNLVPAHRPLIVLNKAGTSGGLAQAYMETTLGLRFDAVIPNEPDTVPRGSILGTPAALLRGPFRSAIAGLARALGVTQLVESV